MGKEKIEKQDVTALLNPKSDMQPDLLDDGDEYTDSGVVDPDNFDGKGASLSSEDSGILNDNLWESNPS